MILQQVSYHVTIHAVSDMYTSRQQFIQFMRYNTGEKILNPPASVLPHEISLFTVCTGKRCSAVSPLPQDFNANFGGDPITDDRPHDTFMRQVAYRKGAFCGTVPDRTAQRAPVVMNLKLPHKQMHHRQGSFFKDLKGKTTTKVIKNILPGHHKLKICSTKQNLSGVNLVGLSL